MKTKILSIFLAGLMVFVGMGGAAAATSQNVATTATVPTNAGLSVGPTSLTYNLASYDVWTDPSQGFMQFQNSGNVALDLYAKIATATPSGIQYKIGTPILTTSDQKFSGGLGVGEIRDQFKLQAMAATGKVPGSYTDIITFSGVAI